jgi:hypothetical protein
MGVIAWFTPGVHALGQPDESLAHLNRFLGDLAPPDPMFGPFRVT